MTRAPRDDDGNPEIVDVTIAEMLSAMRSANVRVADDDVFRYFQTTLYGDNGLPSAGPTLRLTFGQIRQEIR